jgi:hypothetical protein
MKLLTETEDSSLTHGLLYMHNAYKKVVMTFKSLLNFVFIWLSAKITLPGCTDLITYKARIIIKYYDCVYCGRNNPIGKFQPCGAVL